MSVKSPFLIKKRIVDEEGLWGAVVENQSKLYKVAYKDLLKLMLNEERDILVDFAGQDKPAALMVCEERRLDGGRFFFRTVRDKTTKNNFAQVPAVKLISTNKLKRLR